MPELKISQGVWNDFVAIAEKRKRKPEALAQDVLRDFIQHFTDEELLERSCAAARHTTGTFSTIGKKSSSARKVAP